MTLAFIPLIFVGVVSIVILVAVLKAILAPKKTEEVKRLIEEGEYAQAIKIGKSLIDRDNENILAHFYLGKAYMCVKKYQLAMEQFEFLVSKSAFHGSTREIDFRESMAELYLALGQPEEALKEYLLLETLEPKNPTIWVAAGNIFIERGKTDQALKQFNKAIELNGRNAAAREGLAKLLISMKQYIDAKKEISLAIKYEPNKFSNYYYLGKIHREQQNYADAVNAFEKATRDPAFKQKAFLERGICYSATKQYDKAIFEFQRSLSNSKQSDDNDTLYTRYFMAQTYENMRNLDKAIEQWEEISKVKKKFKDVPAKLTEYQDLRANDHMKDYLTSSNAEFIELCKGITVKSFGLAVAESSGVSDCCTIKAVPDAKDTFSNVRTQTTLIYFFRSSDPIPEQFLRRQQEEMKSGAITKCIICTSSIFTSSAEAFAEGRPFELIDKNKLSSIM